MNVHAIKLQNNLGLRISSLCDISLVQSEFPTS